MPKLGTNQKVPWKTREILLQEMRGSFSEELSAIRNPKATIARLVISEHASCHERCHSLSVRGQGKAHHSVLQPSEALTEMPNSSSALAKTITPMFELRGMAQRKFILPLPRSEFLARTGSSCRLWHLLNHITFHQNKTSLQKLLHTCH